MTTALPAIIGNLLGNYYDKLFISIIYFNFINNTVSRSNNLHFTVKENKTKPS